MDSVNRILTITISAAVDALKKKAIEMYMTLLRRLQKGYKDDYQDLLNLICFIDLPVKIDNYEFVKQQFLNTYGTNSLHFSKGCGCQTV